MPRKKKASSDALVVQNAAKTLLANIRFASVDRPVKSIVLTSSVPNEGEVDRGLQPCPGNRLERQAHPYR